jgi:hypothetical protein
MFLIQVYSEIYEIILVGPVPNVNDIMIIMTFLGEVFINTVISVVIWCH